MASEKLEFVRGLYPDGFDVAQLIHEPEFRSRLESLVTPDFELVGAALGMEDRELDSRTPDDVTRRRAPGVAAFFEVWESFLVAWQTWVVTPTEFIEIDDERVLVLLDIRGRSRTHGVEIPVEAANIVTVRDGRLARMELFEARAPAFAAAGLSP